MINNYKGKDFTPGIGIAINVSRNLEGINGDNAGIKTAQMLTFGLINSAYSIPIYTGIIKGASYLVNNLF